MIKPNSQDNRWLMTNSSARLAKRASWRMDSKLVEQNANPRMETQRCLMQLTKTRMVKETSVTLMATATRMMVMMVRIKKQVLKQETKAHSRMLHKIKVGK